MTEVRITDEVCGRRGPAAARARRAVRGRGARVHGPDGARRSRRSATATASNLVFKSSFDKANRSSGATARGPGMEDGLAVLATVKERAGRARRDRHPRELAGGAARPRSSTCSRSRPSCPARPICCARPAATGRAVNVKKGQFLSPPEMANVVEKLEAAGCDRILAHGARDDLRLQRPRRRLPRAPTAARARLPGRLRRHPQRPAARRARRGVRRPARVRPAPRAGGGRGRHRRPLRGGARGSRLRAERRAEHGHAGRSSTGLLTEVIAVREASGSFPVA